ncbi:hypothetical protein, partial [Psittacicella hinzii]
PMRWKWHYFNFSLDGKPEERKTNNTRVYNELSAGEHKVKFFNMNILGAWYSYERTITVANGAASADNLPNFPIPLSKIKVEGGSGRPYLRHTGDSIRVVSDPLFSYKEIFTGDLVNTYRKKSSNNRSWRDPQDIAQGNTITNAISFNLANNENIILNNAVGVVLRGNKINGEMTEVTIGTEKTNGLYFNSKTKQIDLHYSGKLDLNELIYDITEIELRQGLPNKTLRKFSTLISTNEKGIGYFQRELHIVDIDNITVDKVNPSNVQAYVIYDDSVLAGTNAIQVITRDSNGNPVAAAVNITINFYAV